MGSRFSKAVRGHESSDSPQAGAAPSLHERHQIEPRQEPRDHEPNTTAIATAAFSLIPPASTHNNDDAMDPERSARYFQGVMRGIPGMGPPPDMRAALEQLTRLAAEETTRPLPTRVPNAITFTAATSSHTPSALASDYDDEDIRNTEALDFQARMLARFRSVLDARVNLRANLRESDSEDFELPPGGAAEDESRPLPPPHFGRRVRRQARVPIEALPPPPSCLICCTPRDSSTKDSVKFVKPCKCGNLYCISCLKAMFIDTCKDFSRMPPRCCIQIPLHHVRPYLTEEEAELFRAKYEEWGTPKPFYCPRPQCSAFIPDRFCFGKGKQRVDYGVGTPAIQTVSCPKCEVDICTNCRSLAHAGETCGPLEFGVDKEMAELLQKWGYKRCPKCGNGVKRMFGCNHMECRCGAHFCWVCLRGRDSCIEGCEEEEDYDSDEQITEDEGTEETRPQTPTTQPADSSTTAPDQDGPSTKPPTESTTTVTPSAPARARNLDAGSSLYWEEMDLDFGDEPTDNYRDRAWDCDHAFTTAKIKLADAFSRDSARNVGMECMKCWAPVHPEIEMPKSARGGGVRTTFAWANGAADGMTGPVGDARRNGGGKGRLPFLARSLRKSRSTEAERLNMTARNQTAQKDFISSSYSAPMSSSASTSTSGPRGGSRRVVDLHGNFFVPYEKSSASTVPAPLSVPAPAPGHHETSNMVGSKFPFTTESMPFSFAYYCPDCGLLVCHRCKENLEVARREDGDEDDEEGDE